MKLLTKQIASVIFNMNTSSDLMKWVFFLLAYLYVFTGTRKPFFGTDMKGTLILIIIPEWQL